MGDFFNNLFNKGKQPCNCANCRGVPMDNEEIDVEDMTIDLEMEHPEDIIAEYFKMMNEANSIEEVSGILAGLFYEGMEFNEKQRLIEEIQDNIEMLNAIQNQRK